MQDSHWIISPTVREDVNATNFNSTSILCHHFYFCKNSGAGSEVLFFTMLSCIRRHGENSWGRVVQWSAPSPRIKKIVGLNRAASCALLCLHVLLVSTWFFVVMQRSSHGTKTSKGIAILNWRCDWMTTRLVCAPLLSTCDSGDRLLLQGDRVGGWMDVIVLYTVGLLFRSRGV